MGLLQGLNAALSFLTRFGRARSFDLADLPHIAIWFGVTGVMIGGVCALPLWLWHEYGAVSEAMWAEAWAYMVLGVWCTRALHWDGLVDVCDALGSGAQGERFWQIMHDSRMGAFGGIALGCALLGMCIVAREQLLAGQWWLLVWAPAYGRSMAIFFMKMTTAYDSQSLGGRMRLGATPFVVVVHGLCVIVACKFFTFAHAWLLCLGSAVFLVAGRRKALSHGGYNGDMLGAVILINEIWFLWVM